MIVYTDMDTLSFVWDEAKRTINLAKHRLDLARGAELLRSDQTATLQSPRGDEERYVTIGLMDGQFVALVWMRRDTQIRLIS